MALSRFEQAVLLCGGGAIAVVLMMGPPINQGSSSTSTDSLGRPIPANVTNDAELLNSRCGNPDVDDSTEYDVPRPPIPTRFITYKKAHLKFAYIPGGSTKMGDPPPYQWKLIGMMDTRTNQATRASNLEPVLKKRLPCFIGSKNVN